MSIQKELVRELCRYRKIEEESVEYRENLFRGEKGARYEEIGNIIKEFEAFA